MNSPEGSRRSLQEVFDALESVAEDRADSLLLMTVAALRSVHDLYPEADALRLRGSSQHQARVAVHNAIVDVVHAYLSADEGADEGADSATNADSALRRWGER